VALGIDMGVDDLVPVVHPFIRNVVAFTDVQELRTINDVGVNHASHIPFP